jgi:hypothetical protein
MPLPILDLHFISPVRVFTLLPLGITLTLSIPLSATLQTKEYTN